MDIQTLAIALALTGKKDKGATIVYMSEDGSTVLTTETVERGSSGTVVNTYPKESTVQYDYTPSGWAKTAGGAAESDALDNVLTDRVVYAAYTQSIRSYTQTFIRGSVDGGGTLYTQSEAYGTTLTYKGPTPTSTRSGYEFKEWSPALGTVTGAATYTAVFEESGGGEGSEITDDWDTIVAKIQAGTANYSVKDYKPLTIGTEGTVNMRIIARNADPLASGSGNADYTFFTDELLNTSKRWNPARTEKTVGTGTIGGFEHSELRAYLRDTILPLLPESVKNAIVPVTKYTRIYDENETVQNNVATTETVWCASAREMGATSNQETEGPTYTEVFPDNASRVKYKANSSSASSWWLRSANNASNPRQVLSSGSFGSFSAYYADGVAFGFCLSKI